VSTAAFICIPTQSSAQGERTAVVVDTVATTLARPRSMVFVARDTALVASHTGVISLLDVSRGVHRPIAGVPPTLNVGDAGMFDLALDPNFASNRRVFISLAVGSSDSNTIAVVRGRLDRTALSDTATVIIVAAWDTARTHHGGQILLRDGYLFITVGDRHVQNRAQDMGTHHGKLLRVHADGRVPGDNPFVGRAGARPEIWSYGHRNPQGLAFDSATGILWAHEHGPRQGDEVNRIERGRDYGWPRVSWGWEYTGGPIGAGIPVDSATPAPPWVWSQTIAPSGLLVYSGRALAGWRGDLLSGAMQANRGLHLNRLVWRGDRFVLEERLFAGQLGRVRFVTEDARGWIYLGNDDGQILRIRPR
jgi:glucose/arabinose dehydrogenase